MPFKVEVIGELSEVLKKKRDGIGTWVSRSQQAVVFLPGRKYPLPFVLNLWDEQPAYPLGIYSMLPESVYVNSYGDLRITPKLVKVDKVESVKAA
jgi:hypothetical protein